jgi:glycosyltransferase involved in cell wall biosynthesis
MKNDFASPLVSIVLCTYNGESYLCAQLDSIFQQTYSNIEVIAIDDCSKDNTVNILYQYAAQHKSLQIIQNTTNIGYIKNFEKVMALCKGDFIAPCDQDDVWENNKIALMVNNIGQYNMAYCNSELVDAHLNSLHQKMSDIKNSATYNSCLPFIIANCVPGHATLMTRNLFNLATPFPDYIIHDHWLAYVASLHGGVKYIDQVLVKYRNHDNNAIGAVRIKRNKRKNIFTKLKEKKDQLKIIRKKIESFYNTCSAANSPEKEILFDLMMSYKNFSLKNNIKRVQLFLKHRKQLLAIKKRSALRKWFFCYKMFFKIK